MRESVLIFFTSTFPYGRGESFIENEISYLDKFSRVIIIPVSATSEDKSLVRNIRIKNVEVLDVDGDSIKNYKALKYIAKAFCQISFWRECTVALRKGGINGWYKLFQFSVIGEHRTEQVKKILKVLNLDYSTCVVYSYWFHLPLYVALRCINSPKRIISRCHGFDLYEHRSGGYIPYRKMFFDSANFIMPVSNQGTEYLRKIYPDYKNKIVCSRLGTIDHGINDIEDDDVFRIVSCSYMLDLKRIDLIVLALSKCKCKKIEWTHIGDGPLYCRIRKLINESIDFSTVSVTLTGAISNSEVVKLYGNQHFDAFINVSSTEGVPVSIMEAMSFGMPIIATDVGGTSEIVEDGVNGYLLDKDFNIEELAKKIEWFEENKRSNEVINMRIQSRNIWKKKCNAAVNYRDFFELID